MTGESWCEMVVRPLLFGWNSDKGGSAFRDAEIAKLQEERKMK